MGVAEQAIDLTLPRQAEHVPVGRNAINWAKPALGEQWQSARLLVSELLTNAVMHGAGSTMRLRVALTGREFRAEVIDGGNGFEPGPPPADPAIPGGRGLALVDAFAREWGVDTGSTVVWFVLDLGR